MKYNRIFWIVSACLLFSTTLLKGQTGGESVGDHQQPTICEQWKANPGDGRAVKSGGVLCVDGIKVSCDWSSAETPVGVKGCIKQHEDLHHSDLTCPSESGVSRPGLPFTELRESECKAYQATWDCLGGLDRGIDNWDDYREKAAQGVRDNCSWIEPPQIDPMDPPD